MKAILLEQVGQTIADALKQRRRDDPILLATGSDVIGLLLPEGTKETDVDTALWLEEPTGQIVVIIQAKHNLTQAVGTGAARPTFGSCKGMLTVVSEDDEHLKDFEEYMQ